MDQALSSEGMTSILDCDLLDSTTVEGLSLNDANEKYGSLEGLGAPGSVVSNGSSISVSPTRVSQSLLDVLYYKLLHSLYVQEILLLDSFSCNSSKPSFLNYSFADLPSCINLILRSLGSTQSLLFSSRFLCDSSG